MGLAFHFSHQGHFAEVAEVSVDAKNKVTVHKMTVVGDIGPIVNLSGAENQVQGCIVDALSTLGLAVTFENGRIEQTNFDKYPMGRISVLPPELDVHFLDTNYPPSGWVSRRSRRPRRRSATRSTRRRASASARCRSRERASASSRAIKAPVPSSGTGAARTR